MFEVARVFNRQGFRQGTPSVPSLKGCSPSCARATPWWCTAWTAWRATSMTCAASSKASPARRAHRVVKESLHRRGLADGESDAVGHGRVRRVERALIRERQREGIAPAKQRGAYRAKEISEQRKIAELKRIAAGEQKPLVAPANSGISRETLYQYLRRI